MTLNLLKYFIFYYKKTMLRGITFKHLKYILYQLFSIKVARLSKSFPFSAAAVTLTATSSIICTEFLKSAVMYVSL